MKVVIAGNLTITAMGSLVLFACARVALAAPVTVHVDAARSRLVVHVLPKGILSPALHEHHLVPAQWGGTITGDAVAPEQVRGEITVGAGSLHDEQPQLSKADATKVEGEVRGPEVLDASRYPTIRFTATGLQVTERTAVAMENTLNGMLSGRLELHGQTGTLTIPIHARWSDAELHVEGSASFNQSDFGITPYATFLGAIAVHDRVTVEFSITAVPAP